MEEVALPMETFKAFLLGSRRNRMILWLAAGLMLMQFVMFKYFYPFANFIHGDSLIYITIAQENLRVSTHMVGYAQFIRLFSVVTSSDTILVGFQYLLIQGSALFLLFTLFYFYRPGKVIQNILLAFMVVNPLCLHLANLVSSDGYFLALSICWFALLLWLMHKPGTRAIFWHTVVVCLAFTVRYNALVYPVISAVVLLLSKLPLRKKVVGIGIMMLLCGLFVFNTSYHYKKLAGHWQYSPFNGWLMANNAMYAYRHIDSAQRKPVPQRFKQLDQMVRTYFDSTRHIEKRGEERAFEAIVGTSAFMWSPNLTLYKYREYLFRKDTTASELKKWASMGPFYKEYGLYIIRQYPWAYARYFLWPNANAYYAPRMEFLGQFNSGVDEVWPLAQHWFGYKSTKITTRTHSRSIMELGYYPILSGVVNMLMLCCICCFVMLRGFRQNMLFRKGMLLAVIFWLLNAAFTIFASSAALRFQAFPIFLTTTFALLLVDWLCGMATEEKRITNYSIAKRELGRTEVLE